MLDADSESRRKVEGRGTGDEVESWLHSPYVFRIEGLLAVVLCFDLVLGPVLIL
jgi:hypothetical protein